MRLLATTHPELENAQHPCLVRKAARAIILKDQNILLLYTAKYDDYSLPGGGIHEGEDFIAALKRELAEETGAQNTRNIKDFGRYDEYRPWYRDGFKVTHMQSYCYTCEIDEQLLTPQLEEHEIKNGMSPIWMNIHQAIAHNLHIIANSEKQGLSIVRETYLLQLIVEEFRLA